MALFDYKLNTGFIVPNTSTLKADVQAEFVRAFGSDLNLEDETPQGRLIDVEVSARDAVVRTVAELANQINPNFSKGVFLQTLAALHGIRPEGASYSHAAGVKLQGQPGTKIASGSRVATSTGDRFRLSSDVTLNAQGVGYSDVDAVETGPVQAGIGEINVIIDGVFGWQSVTNPTAAVPGASATSTAELRRERNDKLFIMGQGHIQSIMSKLRALPGVRGVTSRTNPSASAATIDGVVLTPHATWINVLGGEDSAIAKTILSAAQAGSPLIAGTNNGTAVTVNVVDEYSGQTYPVIFTRSTEVAVKIKVTYSESLSVSAPNPEVAIADAILSYAAGELEGEAGFINGVPVSPFEVAAAINAVTPGLFIKKVEVAKVADALSTNDVEIALWEQATVSTGNITTEKV